jgi:hypothetical protein
MIVLEMPSPTEPLPSDPVIDPVPDPVKIGYRGCGWVSKATHRVRLFAN